MNNRKQITEKQIEILKNAGIPEMWNKNYAGEYVQIGKDLLVSLGGQGYMNESYKHISQIEKYWGGIINKCPFVASTFWHDKEVKEHEYYRYLEILEINIKENKDEFDIERFLSTFRELVKLHGDCDAKSVFAGCEIINKPKVKYCNNF